MLIHYILKYQESGKKSPSNYLITDDSLTGIIEGNSNLEKIIKKHINKTLSVNISKSDLEKIKIKFSVGREYIRELNAEEKKLFEKIYQK